MLWQITTLVFKPNDPMSVLNKSNYQKEASGKWGGNAFKLGDLLSKLLFLGNNNIEGFVA